MKYNLFKKLFYLVISWCYCLHTYSARAGIYYIWSDKPAYTQVMENENERRLTSDVCDGIWEGDVIPKLPRVPHLSSVVKRWQQGEELNYLNEETNALTRGKYANPTRLWEQEPYPIGNGRLAATVFHGSGRDRYVLNENSYWSGGRNAGTINNKGDKGYDDENGPEVGNDGFGGYQPVGDFIVDFGTPVQKSTFRRELCLDKGITCSYGKRKGVTINSTAFCSFPQQVIVLHYVADRKSGLNANLLFVSQHNNDKLLIKNNALLLDGKLGNGITCSVIATVHPYGGNLKRKDGYLRVEQADSCTILIAIETNYALDYTNDFRGVSSGCKVKKRMNAVNRFTYRMFYQNHVMDYQSLFDRQRLVLDSFASGLDSLPTAERLAAYKQRPSDPGLENIIFNFGRYLMISSSRPGSLPAGLQGIWNGRVYAPWGSDYHSNINFQMVYWLPEVGNLSECHLPMLNYIFATRKSNRIATEEYLKAIGKFGTNPTKGWIVYTSQNPFGGNGWQVNLPGSAWYMLHFWEHFAFTNDTIFLRETAYPVMKEISEYWERHLKVLGKGAEGFESNYVKIDVSKYPELAKVKAGTMVVPNGWSPEIGPRGEDGVTHDQQIVSELFMNTIKAAEVLKVDKQWIKHLREVLNRMYPSQIGKKGNLMEWMIDRDPITDHRHTSHLFAVFPGCRINMETTPALAEAARKSLMFRKTTGNSHRAFAWAWRSLLWARLRNGEKAHNMLEGLLTHNMLDNLFTTQNLPMQIDGNYGITAAMLEMLVQSHSGVIELLPAPTTKWKSGSLQGARTRGNLEVDITWKEGKVLTWNVYAKSFPVRKVKVRVNGIYQEVMPKVR